MEPRSTPPVASPRSRPPEAAVGHHTIIAEGESGLSLADRNTMVQRTRTGLTLLLVGSLLSWIPVVEILGAILIFIGAVFVIFGREVFGPAHSRNVILAAVLYTIVELATYVLLAGLEGALLAGMSLPLSQVESAITSAFNRFLLGTVAVGVLTGIAVVLFLYGLLDLRGKTLIWASFFSGLLIQVFVYTTVMYQLPGAIRTFIDGYPFHDSGPLQALDNQMMLLGLLTVIPALLAAAAAYVALSRIDSGQIPRRLPRKMPSPVVAPAVPPR